MSSMKFPDIGKPSVTRQDTCLFPIECAKSRQCENWLRDHEGCEAASARNASEYQALNRQKRAARTGFPSLTPAERGDINSRIRLSLTPRQFDHIIAGLRVYQDFLAVCGDPCAAACAKVHEIATEHGPLMTAEEIDAFVEEINR